MTLVRHTRVAPVAATGLCLHRVVCAKQGSHARHGTMLVAAAAAPRCEEHDG